VKVFPTAFLGPPASVAGRKSPAHGEIPPRLPGSVNSAAVPGVRVPSAERSTAALRKVAMFNDAISRRTRSRIGSVPRPRALDPLNRVRTSTIRSQSSADSTMSRR
jgi:hypothetical protein